MTVREETQVYLDEYTNISNPNPSTLELLADGPTICEMIIITGNNFTFRRSQNDSPKNIGRHVTRYEFFVKSYDLFSNKTFRRKSSQWHDPCGIYIDEDNLVKLKEIYDSILTPIS